MTSICVPEIGNKPSRLFYAGIKRDPYSFLSHRELGELLRVSGQLDQGTKELEFVVKYFPEADSKTYMSLALAYNTQGRRNAANEILEKDSRLFPSDPASQRFPLSR